MRPLSGSAAGRIPTNSVDLQDSGSAGWIAAVRQAISGLRFGSVEIVVHDGRVVQIERREKLRLEATTSEYRSPDSRQREEQQRRRDRTSGGAGSVSTDERQR